MFPLHSHPDRYAHWKLDVQGEVARLTMAVNEDKPLFPGYVLKLNSYDLGVDIELNDAVTRLRFEHPGVKVVIVSSGLSRVFCSGANIHMLGASTHAFKVNFCKYTNETRLGIEDASRHSGQKYLAAVNGACAGGGYELALACDEILLIDDGSSTVSLPEVPLLGVLPGTGGLTRVVDKRHVRRDHADVFSTVAEGVKGQRAVQWNLIDATVPRSKFADAVNERARKLAETVSMKKSSPGVKLSDIEPTIEDGKISYRYVQLSVDEEKRTAALTVHAPKDGPPNSVDAILAQGDSFWPLQTFRELDDAILRLRLHYDNVGMVTLHSRGNGANVLAYDAALDAHKDHWFVSEVRLFMARTLRRLDTTARSLYAVIDEGSCFYGSFLELVLAADRGYMLEDADGKVTVQASVLNGGAFPMGHGPTRLGVRFLAAPGRAEEALAAARKAPLAALDADKAGLITVVCDDIDFEDELRVAIEERVSLSPDALTGMEANLRFAGPESPETKIFGRLSAWQNWIFTRPNATGERGALTMYGKPERPKFDWRRT